jgi:phosphatidylglycerol lysyltransferase
MDMSITAAMQMLRSHGRAAASFQILTSDLNYWFSGQSCVAYSDVGGAWVALGGPIGPKEREAEVTRQFIQEARRRGKRVRFFAFENEVPVDAGLTALHIGEQPVWNPADWPDSLPTKIRGQLRRDLKKATVRLRLATHAEIEDPSSATRRGLDEVISQWLDTRKMAPMDFMVQVNPYSLARERRFFVAELEGKVVAALIAVPVYGRNGWFLETLLRDPRAPNGTVELLFSHAMETFAAGGSSYVTFGMCPLSGANDTITKLIRRGAKSFYNFDGLRKFKGKLGPSEWEPVYLAYPKGDSSALALVDSLRAFLGGGFIRFGLRTMVQRASAVSAVIAALLLPWTVLLALADTEHWFPSRAVHLGWVALDLLLLGGFVSLARKFQKPLALALGACAGLDFVLSCLQFSSHNLSRTQGADWLFSAVGILAPLACALFLWFSRNRNQLYTASVSTDMRPVPVARIPRPAKADARLELTDSAVQKRVRAVSSEVRSRADEPRAATNLPEQSAS